MGAHQFTGSATLGPYLGYKFDTENYGWSTTLALFAGASNIAVAKQGTTSNSKPTSTQVAGFGYGGGLLVEVKGGFQAGAVIGWDYVGSLASDETFQYNNKPWVALRDIRSHNRPARSVVLMVDRSGVTHSVSSAARSESHWARRSTVVVAHQ